MCVYVCFVRIWLLMQTSNMRDCSWENTKAMKETIGNIKRLHAPNNDHVQTFSSSFLLFSSNLPHCIG